jgi:hypothetical protein
MVTAPRTSVLALLVLPSERSPGMAEEEQIVEEQELEHEELEAVSGGDDEGPSPPPVGGGDGR